MTVKEINTKDIRKIFDMLINKAEESGFEKIKLTEDYYWIVSRTEKRIFSSAPQDLTIGSLYDDIEGLEQMMKKVYLPTTLDFERLGNIIIAMGELIEESDKIFV